MRRRFAAIGATALLLDTSISSCGPDVCKQSRGVPCGPNSQTCGGP